jgi:hypothetical protein
MKAFIPRYSSLSTREQEFLQTFLKVCDFKQVPVFNDSQVLLFMGNGNINPVFYGEEPINNRDDVLANYKQDCMHLWYLRRAVDTNKFIIGIGRAGLLAAAFSGSNIVSKASHHNIDKPHWVFFKDYSITELLPSKHEQLIYPYNLINNTEFQIQAQNGNPKFNGYHENSEKFSMPLNQVEPEVVYFPKTRVLATTISLHLMDSGAVGSSRSINCLKNIIKKFTKDNLCQNLKPHITV